MKKATPLFCALFLVLFALNALGRPLLLISVDGLEPKDVFETSTDRKVPNLRSLIADSAYATVRGVIPTITYPSHTTLVTGVGPALHGVSSNQTFDPFDIQMDTYYWYASDIKVPALWDVVHQNEKTVAAFKWPVSVASRAIDFNIPDFWRLNNANDIKLVSAVSTPGIFDLLEIETGISGIKIVAGDRIERDVAVSRYASKLMELKKPYFTLVHLTGLDHVKHVYGPGSKEALAALEISDKTVGDLVKTAKTMHPDGAVAIVSDHGFSSIKYAVNLLIPFAKAGLVQIDPATKKVKSYQAIPWDAGGSAFIVLKDPKDQKTRNKVAALLTNLASNPQTGIARFLTKEEIEAQEGPKEADFVVDFNLEYMSNTSTSDPLISATTRKGMHGYLPEHKEMRAIFIISGPTITKKGSLGDVDMRDIAPTLAKILDVTLPQVTGKPLSYK